ncbi:MAG: hypothetical protein PHG67_02185 [Bacteroidales bacterium]|jgi:hypothetical protein|nr:hypothetical protein [Bacteroidales bacterium]
MHYCKVIIFTTLILLLLASCAKRELDIDIGRVEVINESEKPHAVFVKLVGDSLALEQYVGTLPIASHILVPLRAKVEYELKIGEINTGRVDKFESRVRLQKDEYFKLIFNGID